MDIENGVSENKSPSVLDDNGKVVSDIAKDEESEAIAPASVGWSLACFWSLFIYVVSFVVKLVFRDFVTLSIHIGFC